MIACEVMDSYMIVVLLHAILQIHAIGAKVLIR